MKNLWKPFLTCLVASLLAFLLLPSTALAGAGEDDEDGQIVVKKRLRPRIVVECNEDAEDCWAHRRGMLREGGFLGVELTNLSPELRRHFGGDENKGVMISRVVEDGPAAAAGLRVGDLLLSLDGEDVTSSGEVGRLVFRREAGDLLDIAYLRDGHADATTAKVVTRKRSAAMLDDLVVDLPHLGNLEIPHFNTEAFEKAMEAVGDAFDDVDWDARLGDWQERMEDAYERIDFDKLDDRMEVLQERLKELEERLEREYGDNGHSL